ncbi:PREDICTED: proline-rich basic protein 1 [Chinchilla lanigera]|uniref:proline-rich basic protein 1 n=1 Tax=Chinchilla lanigera TaxID=34839 RepID=UPI000698152F|nr:PREDICTED: proline-rich basic protein 1 [Chinchilla lanigera]
MLTALGPPAAPGLPRRLPAAPARRQDSSGSSGSYHTAPGSPEPPDAGPDAGSAARPRAGPGRGAGAQPRLSISAQNSRQQLRGGSGFPRGPGSGPPPQPQLRVLPSGEMEVIFGAGALFSRSDAEDREVRQLTAQPFSPSSTRTASQVPAPPRPLAPDGGSRWATYLELRPSGPSPAACAQFECVEVALEERAEPARPRTVPKRQIELRPKPPSPPREACAPRPRLLLRTGSLDESLSRLQVAAGLVQTALARKLGPATPAPSSVAVRPTERPEPKTGETARSTRSWPARAQEGSGPARAPRPWPSLRERAIRRDKPAPGTEPLGPVSSSIFLQSEEKIQEARNQRPKTRFPQETPGRTVPREPSPSLESRVPWEVRSSAERPKSPSPPGRAPNGPVRDPRGPCPQSLSPWSQAAWRVSSPPFREAPSAWGSRAPAVPEGAGGRSPSPPTPSQWNRGGARARSPSPEVPSPWEVPPPAARRQSPSQPNLCPGDAPDRPIGTRSPSPQETWGPSAQGSPIAFGLEAMNGVAQELTPPTPGTPQLTGVQSPPTPEIPDPASRGGQPSPEGGEPEPPCAHLVGTPDADTRPGDLGSGEGASERPRAAIPRPRDVRKMVKTTYAPSFPAGGPGPARPAPPAQACVEGGLSQTPALQALRSPAPAHYTSVLLKDFLPVVPHPYESPEPSLDTAPRDASQPNGVLRRRAENSTAKPFARTEIRLPGVLAWGGRPERTPGAPARSVRREREDVEASRLGLDGEGRTSPPGGARSSPPRAPRAPPGPRPPRTGSPQARPDSSPGKAPTLETPAMAPEPAAALQAPLPPQPRAASAPPTDRCRPGSSQGTRRPPGASQPGKVLVDPESGRYYFVEAPRQPRLRLLFDPESGQYVEVLLPPASPGLPRRVYTPLAVGPGLYPPAYGPMPGLALPSSPGPPALSSAQLPWVSEAGPLEGLYYLPVSGTPSPAPPLLFCAPPSSAGPPQPGKGSVVPL